MATMTRAQARSIMAELKTGKIYRTRFQEQEWGLRYLGQDLFLEWGREYDLSGRTHGSSFEKKINTAQLLELLLQYNYERTRAGLQQA